ncbi:hypothetical protein DXG01_014398, partial [Tephrocybe rancida]
EDDVREANLKVHPQKHQEEGSKNEDNQDDQDDQDDQGVEESDDLGTHSSDVASIHEDDFNNHKDFPNNYWNDHEMNLDDEPEDKSKAGQVGFDANTFDPDTFSDADDCNSAGILDVNAPSQHAKHLQDYFDDKVYSDNEEEYQPDLKARYLGAQQHVGEEEDEDEEDNEADDDDPQE